MQENSRKTIYFLIEMCTICICIGRGCQYILRDAPIRALLWKSDWLQSFVENTLHISWKDWVSSAESNANINNFTHACGWILIGSSTCILLSIWLKQSKWVSTLTRISIGIAASILVFDVFLQYIESNFKIAMLIEHALQIGVPLFLILPKSWVEYKQFRLLKFCISSTFIGHALFAIGYYPQPGNFVDMFLGTFTMEEASARKLLFVFGVLDIIAAIGIWFRNAFIFKSSMWYCVIWGLLTAFGRITGGVNFDLFFYTFSSYWFQTVYRFVHGIGPLIALLVWKENRNFGVQKKAAQ